MIIEETCKKVQQYRDSHHQTKYTNTRAQPNSQK
jgi:hypothetical protein